MNINKDLLVNPYDLLGFDSKKPNIPLKELKKKYYALALLCHPDKGGNKDDMIILEGAYNYLKCQMEICNQKPNDYDTALNDFEEFMKTQTDKYPPFSQIYEDMNEWLQEFNKKFEKYSKLSENYMNDTGLINLEDGYGHLMEESENIKLDTQSINKNKKKEDLEKDLQKPLKNKFGFELAEYHEPESLDICAHNYYDFSNRKVSNYSAKLGTVEITDYRVAFENAPIVSTKTQIIEKSDPEEFKDDLTRLIEERKKFDESINLNYEKINTNFKLQSDFKETNQ